MPVSTLSCRTAICIDSIHLSIPRHGCPITRSLFINSSIICIDSIHRLTWCLRRRRLSPWRLTRAVSEEDGARAPLLLAQLRHLQALPGRDPVEVLLAHLVGEPLQLDGDGGIDFTPADRFGQAWVEEKVGAALDIDAGLADPIRHPLE